MNERFIGAYSNNWSDGHGICLLTGEADAMGLRILSDVNEDGKLLLQTLFGLPDIKFSESMNSKVNGKPAIGSIFIPVNLLHDIKIIALMCCESVVEVWEMTSGDMRGMTETDCEEDWAKSISHLYHTSGLSEEVYKRWYDLQQKINCGEEVNDTELREWHTLEDRKRHFHGLRRRYVKAPRNRRGPAGDSLGLTHRKMM